MTVGVSDDWESAQTGPWLVALALSCAVHGAVVWEGRSFVWTERTWVRAAMPVELVSPSPEPPHAAPPPVTRPASRPAAPPAPDAKASRIVPVAPARAQTEEPSRELPAASPAPTGPTETHAEPQGAVPVRPSSAASAENSSPGTARGDFTSPSPARPEAAPGPSIAAVLPSSPSPARTTQPARPRGGYQVRPGYPAVARRAGAEGTTVLRVHVRADGTIDDVQVSRSAGHAALDEAAAAAVARWRFEPARSGSEAVAVWVLIPVEFRLQNEN
jgi:protein TonB